MMNEPLHAWIYVMGVVTGIVFAMGATMFVAHVIRQVIKEAREVIEEMRKVVAQAHGVASNVAANYVPLKTKVDQIEREVNDIRTILKEGRLP